MMQSPSRENPRLITVILKALVILSDLGRDNKAPGSEASFSDCRFSFELNEPNGIAEGVDYLRIVKLSDGRRFLP